MSADAHTIAVPIASATSRKNWIESPFFDNIFFTLSPLATFPLIALTLFADQRFAIFFFFLAFPHYMSTLSFFFWDEYKPRHRARWLAFFGGPVLIAVTFGVLVFLQLPKIISVTLFLWNTFHVSRQSCGILSIYRHRAGVSDAKHRDITNFAIISTCLWLSFWNIQTHDAFDPLYRLSADYPSYVRLGLGAIAAVGLTRLAMSLWARVRDGNAPRLPETMFLITSIVLFTPFLFVQSSIQATSFMLLPHYLQYLGIVWLINRRRFRAPEGSSGQRALQKVSANSVLLLSVLIGIGVATIASKIFLEKFSHPLMFESLYLLLALEHFYLDGLIWAFRDPTVRKSLGPYLNTYDPQASQLAA